MAEYLCCCDVNRRAELRHQRELNLVDQATARRGVVVECATPEDWAAAIDQAWREIPLGNMRALTQRCPHCRRGRGNGAKTAGSSVSQRS